MRQLVGCTVVALLLTGCGGENATQTAKKTPKSSTKSPNKKKPKKKKRRYRFKTSARFRKFQKEYDEARKELPNQGTKTKDDEDPTTTGGSKGLSENAAIQRIGAAIVDSMELRPTLVIWLIDASASATNLREQTTGAVAHFYSELGDKEKKHKNKLVTAVASFGEKTQWIVDEPTADPGQVAESLKQIPADTSGKESTFTALQKALSKSTSFRRQGYEVITVVITDEAGDDAKIADEVIRDVKKKSVVVYVVGVPVAFGRLAGVAQSVEGGRTAWSGRLKRGKRRRKKKPTTNGSTPVRQGPESRESEFVQIPFWGNRQGSLIDAGFGPFQLERLCRASNGHYVAIRRQSFDNAFPASVTDQWPSANAVVCSSSVMRRYAPDYVTATRYQELLQSNKARLALHRAGKMSITNLPEPLLVFAKARNEAEFSRRLTQAQQLPAIVQPQIDRIFSVLRQGESDRPKLKNPRWKAAFDLAFGRALAMKVRIDAYNTLLAAMKRGKKFQNPNSTQWILQGSDTIEGSSSLNNNAKKARKYLKAVVTEHAGTPWAHLAQMELETPIGWQWTEQ